MSDSEAAGMACFRTPKRTEREALRDVFKLPAVPKFVLGQRVVYRGRECRIVGVGTEAGEIVYDNSLGHWGYESQYTAAGEV